MLIQKVLVGHRIQFTSGFLGGSEVFELSGGKPLMQSLLSDFRQRRMRSSRVKEISDPSAFLMLRGAKEVTCTSMFLQTRNEIAICLLYTSPSPRD